MRTVPTDAGLLLLDKPAEGTSHDVVLRVRRALGLRRVGHTGTLDPFATGLLLALIGPFTRLADLFHVLPKAYEATMELGRETETDDLTGATVTDSPEWRVQTPDAIRVAFAAREGAGLQVPSSYSAKRVDGRRAHDVARRGGRLELAPSAVTVYELEVTAVALPEVRFRARVSTGTFIRALARDVGRDLGCGGHLTRLRRISIGPFLARDAMAVGDLAKGGVLPAGAWFAGADAVPWMRRRRLSGDESGEVALGRPVGAGDVAPPPWSEAHAWGITDGPVALVSDARLVAIAELRGDQLQPRKVFAA